MNFDFGDNVCSNDMELVRIYPIDCGIISLMKPTTTVPVERNCHLETCNQEFFFECNAEFIENNIQHMSAKIGDYAICLMPCENGVICHLLSKYHSLVFLCNPEFSTSTSVQGILNADNEYHMNTKIVGDMVKINTSCDDNTYCSQSVELNVIRELQEMVKNLMAIMKTSNYKM
jgi:hypothetical protein